MPPLRLAQMITQGKATHTGGQPHESTCHSQPQPPPQQQQPQPRPPPGADEAFGDYVLFVVCHTVALLQACLEVEDTWLGF